MNWIGLAVDQFARQDRANAGARSIDSAGGWAEADA
jgi:hypothetical protein